MWLKGRKILEPSKQRGKDWGMERGAGGGGYVRKRWSGRVSAAPGAPGSRDSASPWRWGGEAARAGLCTCHRSYLGGRWVAHGAEGLAQSPQVTLPGTDVRNGDH